MTDLLKSHNFEDKILLVRHFEKCRNMSREANVSCGVVSSCLELVESLNLATLPGNKIIYR